jgi:predicted phosphate transport protein (TIGR00153 family)
VRFRLVPVDDEFFTLFSASARNVADAARRLRDLVNDPSHIEQHLQLVVDCERKGDAHVKSILQRLGTSFVTPFDREDIHALAEELDDVVDDILSIAGLLRLMKVDVIIPELEEQADILVQMAERNAELIDRLEKMRDVRELLDDIDRLESDGDAVHQRTIARLFGGDFEALDVIRWKDIVQAMEHALNTIEDVSDIVESIVLKHA